MCLLVLALRAHPDYPLIFAGNRDEFHARPTEPASWWSKPSGFIAGRDLQAGGTWAGLSRSGRFAVVTNFRDMAPSPPGAPSRGELVPAFCAGEQPAREWRLSLRAQAGQFAGFNLLYGTADDLHYATNRGPGISPLGAGVHGLSNHLLDTPWPKLERTRAGFERLLAAGAPQVEELLALLGDRTPAPPERLPATGLSSEMEALLSAPFIVSPGYGTRSSTIVLISASGEARFVERSYASDGSVAATVDERFPLIAAE